MSGLSEIKSYDGSLFFSLCAWILLSLIREVCAQLRSNQKTLHIRDNISSIN